MCDPRLNRLVSLLFTVSPMPYPGNILGVFGRPAFLASVIDCNDVCRSLNNVVSLQLASFVVFSGHLMFFQPIEADLAHPTCMIPKKAVDLIESNAGVLDNSGVILLHDDVGAHVTTSFKKSKDGRLVIQGGFRKYVVNLEMK